MVTPIEPGLTRMSRVAIFAEAILDGSTTRRREQETSAGGYYCDVGSAKHVGGCGEQPAAGYGHRARERDAGESRHAFHPFNCSWDSLPVPCPAARLVSTLLGIRLWI